MGKRRKYTLDELSNNVTHLVGTSNSIIVHTILFIGIFALTFFGYSMDQVLLILTTAVSLEAIYLAIFIQMTVNRTTISLANVEEDIDDIQEDVDDIQEDVDDIQEDVDSLESNIKGISDDYIDDSEETEVVTALKDIETRLKDLQGDIAVLKKKGLF